MPYRVSSAPGIFQRVMENLLKGIPGVVVYIDDILITGASSEEHLQALNEVLQRLEKAGLQAKKQKCEFMSPSVTYLGHHIDAKGLHRLTEKVQAVKEAPPPRNVQEFGLTHVLQQIPTANSSGLPSTEKRCEMALGKERGGSL